MYRAYVDFVSSYKGISDYRYQIINAGEVLKSGRITRENVGDSQIRFKTYDRLSVKEKLAILQGYYRYADDKLQKFKRRYAGEDDPIITEGIESGRKDLLMIQRQIQDLEREMDAQAGAA